MVGKSFSNAQFRTFEFVSSKNVREGARWFDLLETESSCARVHTKLPEMNVASAEDVFLNARLKNWGV